jgi:type I restriction enzyme, S subunit
MTSDLKPYPAYKDSGVRWLGEVPEHWEVLRLKHICRLAYGDALATDVREHGTVPVYGSNGRVGFHSSANAKAPCIIIGRKGSFGKVNFSAEPVFSIDTTFFVDERSSSANLRWLFFLLGRLRLDEVSRDSAVPGLDRQDVYQRIAALPPHPEQTAIVRFLDHADRRIRRYIRAKQKLIKLLEEQKQAIIHRAVTRGLDPNVRLKPSGLEWLGEVPEHWEVVRAGSVCDFISAKAHEQFVEPDGEHICVTARFVSTDGRSYRRCTKNLSPAQRGDVLMVMSDLPRGRALARAYFVNDDQNYAVNQRVCILRANRVHPRYLAFVANRHPELLDHDDGFNQTHLPNAAFKIMRLPLPPSIEQAEIAGFLVRATSSIDVSAESASREIELLREYHTRLIADVVTGKLDVREAAARLPEEIGVEEDAGAPEEGEEVAEDSDIAAGEGIDDNA